MHSSDINYGSGSGQQAVTGFDNDHDYNSLWIIKEADMNQEGTQDPVPPCRTGEPLKCGDYLRLEHMNTGRNLHSHSAFNSPISGRQEVSGFGNGGDGDGGDNWRIECDTGDRDGLVYGETRFYLKHKDTGNYLYTDVQSKFNNHNCHRCPIIGHSEISSSSGKSRNAVWKVHSGFFFPPAKRETQSEY